MTLQDAYRQASGASQDAFDSNERRLAGLKLEVAAAEERVQRGRGDLESLRDQAQALEKERAGHQHEVQDLTDQIQRLQSQAAEAEAAQRHAYEAWSANQKVIERAEAVDQEENRRLREARQAVADADDEAERLQEALSVARWQALVVYHVNLWERLKQVRVGSVPRLV